MKSHITPDLSTAVDQSVLAAMRIETPGLITVLETLIRIGENDETILARCRENSPTDETMRNITHALAALRKKDRPEPEHTPGPWEITIGTPEFDGEPCNGQSILVFGPKRMGRMIAVAACGLGSEAKGNARLIAAAPDMLRALVAIRAMAASRSRVNMPDGVSLEAFCRTAIAAATKGSP